jgi:hypothetical protein
MSNGQQFAAKTTLKGQQALSINRIIKAFIVGYSNHIEGLFID